MLNDPRMKRIVRPIVNSIATALDVDIMIIDAYKNVVGGTVKKEKTYFVSKVYDYIRETQEFIVIKTPGKHALCQGCRYYQCCSEMIEINAPIILHNKFIGLISITTYSKENRDLILKKLDSYSDFVKQMCEMLANRAEEEVIHQRLNLTTKELYTIINSIDEGIFLLNDENKFSYCNYKIEEFFGANSSTIIGTKIEYWFPKFEDYIKKSVKQREVKFNTKN